MNKILALYPDLGDHHVLYEAFADSQNEIVCVATVSEAVRLLIEQSFTLVFIDSKLIDSRGDEIATTIKTISNVPVIIVDSVIYAKNRQNSGHKKARSLIFKNLAIFFVKLNTSRNKNTSHDLRELSSGQLPYFI